MKSTVLLHFISLMMMQLAAQPRTVNIHGIVKDTTLKSIEISHVSDAKLTKFENKKLNVVKEHLTLQYKFHFRQKLLSHTEIGFSLITLFILMRRY